MNAAVLALSHALAGMATQRSRARLGSGMPCLCARHADASGRGVFRRCDEVHGACCCSSRAATTRARQVVGLSDARAYAPWMARLAYMDVFTAARALDRPTTPASACEASPGVNAQLVQHERIHLGGFAITPEAPGLAAMPRFHVDA